MGPNVQTLLPSFFDKKLTVELLASPRFQNLGLRLTPGNLIRFQGVLSSPSFGAFKPELVLSFLECLSCQSDGFDDHSESSNQPTGDLPDVTIFAASALQGAADFILPHFLRLNVTQLLYRPD